MKTQTAIITFLITMGSILTSCTQNVSLSDEEAQRLVKQNIDFSVIPVSIQKEVEKGSPIGLELGRLVRDGFLVPDAGGFIPGLPGSYKPSKQGEAIVGKCHYNPAYSTWDTTEFYGLQPQGVEIISKAVDSHNRIAVVRYRYSLAPTEYLQKLMKLDPNQVGEAIRSRKENAKTDGEMKLKMWDDGWRPM